MQKEKGISTLTGIIIIVAAAVILFGGVFAWQYFAKSQTPITNVQPNSNSQNSNKPITGSNINSTLPTKVGECSKTAVLKIETRLVDGSTGQPIAGSGSAIEYTNGGYQVSYGTIQGVKNSHVGDEINLCLLYIPTNCPLRDNRGKIYSATNLRTGENWEAPDAEHMCGGA
jgi:hypothetical protein